MKELSIEEKAKRYDEAYKVAKNIHIFSSDLAEIKRMEDIFPELKESEDDMIRKAIGYAISQSTHSDGTLINGVSSEEAISWLEKQGNPTEDELEALRMAAYEPTKNWSEKLQSLYEKLTHCEQKPADKVESKFHEGDWVVHDMSDGRVTPPVHIVEVTTKSYVFDDSQCFYFKDAEDTYRKWTIEDAKPGDVLVDQNGEMPFIFKECKNNHIYCYCGYTNRKDIFFDRFVDSEGEELHWLNLYHEQAYPATKEQRDLLFQKMKETGYKWDAEKKELRKIERKFNIGDEIKTSNEESLTITKIDEKGYWSEDLFICNFDDADKWKLVEQKPAWSEEDEVKINRIVACLENLIVADNDILLKDVDWLKSLRPQNRWKPSDEQLYWLKWTVNRMPDTEKANEAEAVLEDLLEQLKKTKIIKL